MKNKIIELLNKKYDNPNIIAYLIGSTALISAILGLIRNRLLAHFIGAGETLDIYFAAFKIPDFIFLFSTSFISIFAILPFFSDKENESKEALKKFMDACFTVFIIILLLISTITFVILPYLTERLFSFEGEALKTLISFSRLFLLQVILLAVSTFLLSIVQSKHKFLSYALSPIVYNAGILLGVVGYLFFGPYALVFGVIFGAFLHFALQIPPIIKEKLIPKLSAGVGSSRDVLRVIKHSFPRSLSISFEALSAVIIIGIISSVGIGSVTIFSLADGVSKVPLIVIGISYSVASFPLLSKHFSSERYDEFIKLLTLVLKNVFLLAIPTAVIFFLLRFQIIKVIIGSTGSFGLENLKLTSAAFGILVPAIVTQSITTIIIRAFFAAKKTLVPFLISLTKFVLIISSSVLFLNLFKSNSDVKFFVTNFFDVPTIQNNELLSISLAITFTEFVIFLLSLFLIHHILHIKLKTYFRSLLENILATILFGSGVYIALLYLPISSSTILSALAHGLLSGVCGLVLWGATLHLFKNKEYLSFRDSIIFKIKRKKII